ncbi:MAG: TIGR03085 family protein [Actinomycetota bacterium]|nr:MAG: TIGR03085 family protein [Actinomycetota bacterium]
MDARWARSERRGYADALAAAGPLAPTRCAGWSTRDLAAHTVIRDSRPDAMPGIVVPVLAGWTQRVQQDVATWPWQQLLDRVRSGPPWWSPVRLAPIDAATNTVEMFVHHEDVRRAQPGWTPRSLPAAEADALWHTVTRSARLALRGCPVGVWLQRDPGRAPRRGHGSDPSVTLWGPSPEIVLAVYGRSRNQAEVLGEPDAVAAFRSWRYADAPD